MSLELLTKAVEDHGTAVKNMSQKVDESLTKAERALELVEKMEEKGVRLRGRTGAADSKGAIQAFLKSTGLDAIRSGGQSTGRVELPEISVKALVNVGRGQAGDSEYTGQAERAAGVRNDPRLALQLLDVLPTIKVGAGTYEYTQLQGFDNNADYQATEGALKAESSIELTQASANIETIAHWTRASVQVLDDESSLQSYIGNLLGYGLLSKLEDQLINGPGGTGKIHGLKAQATPVAVTAGATPIDRIGSATAGMKATGWKPSLLLINPLDWFDITLTKDADGNYLIGGPQNPASATLWGNTVVETPSLARGTALLIDTANVAILDRMQPVVIATRFDRDNLVTNLVTLLSELRAGVAVFAKDAVRSVDISVV